MRLLSVIIPLLLVAGGIKAVEDTAISPDVPVLHKGVNLSNWLANAERQPLKEADFSQIKSAGFDNVRLPVKPDILENRIAEVDKAIVWAAKHDLATVIDLHPDSRFMKELETTEAAEQKFIHLWEDVARHYKNYRPDRVVFELVNEPQYYYTEDKYNALVARTVAAIRAVDSEKFLIVAAPRGSSIEGLQTLKPVDDRKILYDFHFYQPYVITHQGVHRGFEGRMLRYFHNVPYPSALVSHDAAFYAGDAPDKGKAETELKAYIAGKWDRDALEKAIQPAKIWADKNHVAIICGEFGVLRNHIDADSRYRWIADTRKTLERDNIGWQIWDYTDLDGITRLEGNTRTDSIDGSVKLADPETGRRLIEKEAVSALGLIQSVAAVTLPLAQVEKQPAMPAPSDNPAAAEAKKEDPPAKAGDGFKK